MAKKSGVVRTTATMKITATKAVQGNSTDDTPTFTFGWEGLSVEPLIFEARAIVDNVWPNTETPDIVDGVWDETPIMQAVIVALRRGIEIGEGDTVASA